MGASFDSMPQENYKLTEFNWDRTLEKMQNSDLIVGDLSNEGIEYTKGVVCAHVKVKDDKVSFNLSFYGKIQLSNPNNELLRRAKSKLRNLIVCNRWVQTDEMIEKSMSNERFWERLSTIRLENLADPAYAYFDLRFFMGTLPHHIRNLVEPEIQQVDLALIRLSRNPSWQRVKQERKKEFMKYVVLVIINRISALIHGQIGMGPSQNEKIDFDSSFMSWLEENKEEIIEAVEALKTAARVLRRFSKESQKGPKTVS